MSKTFTGTVNFTFKMVLTDDEVREALAIPAEEYTPGFAQYLKTLTDDDSVLIALVKHSVATGVKGAIDTGGEDGVTVSPISVKVEAKTGA